MFNNINYSGNNVIDSNDNFNNEVISFKTGGVDSGKPVLNGINTRNTGINTNQSLGNNLMNIKLKGKLDSFTPAQVIDASVASSTFGNYSRDANKFESWYKNYHNIFNFPPISYLYSQYDIPLLNNVLMIYFVWVFNETHNIGNTIRNAINAILFRLSH